MRPAATVLSWLREGRRVAAALLVENDGVAPLRTGATLWVAADGAIAGGIAGGAIEASVAAEARSLLEGGGAARLVAYGITGELAASAGLASGGMVRVLVHELSPASRDAATHALAAVVENRPSAVATVLDGPSAGRQLYVDAGARVGGLGGPELLDESVEREARGMIRYGRSAIRELGPDGARLRAGLRVHVLVHARAPQLVLAGAVDHAAAVAAIADEVGYRVTIVDPRIAFQSSARFSTACATVATRPEDVIAPSALGPRDAVLVCADDPAVDVPALLGAFATEAGCIAVLADPPSTAARTRRLRAAGASDGDLRRLRAIDLGATVEATAVGVLGALVARR